MFLRPPSPSSSESENSSSHAIRLSWARTAQRPNNQYSWVKGAAQRAAPGDKSHGAVWRVRTSEGRTGDAFVGVLVLLVPAVLLHGVLRDSLHLHTGRVGQHAQVLKQTLPVGRTTLVCTPHTHIDLLGAGIRSTRLPLGTQTLHRPKQPLYTQFNCRILHPMQQYPLGQWR